MNAHRTKLTGQQEHMQRLFQTKQSARSKSVAGFGGFLQEAGRYASDFGRQVFLLAGLLLLLAIIAAATTGNQTFAEFVRWSGL